MICSLRDITHCVGRLVSGKYKTAGEEINRDDAKTRYRRNFDES